MKADSIMDDLRAVKDKLAREAGYDANRFIQNLRQWETAHPHSGRVIRDAEELRQFAASEERKRAEASALILSENSSSASG